MKIDFLARYREVARLVEAPTTATKDVAAAADFGRLIGEIAPDRPQVIESTDNPAAPKNTAAVPREGPGEPKGSFSFDAQRLSGPELTPMAPPETPPPAVGSPDAGVKTPTVISARRVPHHEDEPHRERVSAVRSLVEKAGGTFGVDPTLSLAVVSRESSFNTKAVSQDGHQSKGLFQLLDRTGHDLLERLGIDKPYDPFNPEQNVYLGVGYLRHLHDLFRSDTQLPTRAGTTFAAANSTSLEKLAVAAFNAGEGRVAAAQHRAKEAGFDPALYDHVEPYLPGSTRDYVAKVIQAKGNFTPEVVDAFRPLPREE